MKAFNGSNWPVSALTHAYADWVAMLERFTRGSSRAEQAALWAGTARRIYRIAA